MTLRVLCAALVVIATACETPTEMPGVVTLSVGPAVDTLRALGRTRVLTATPKNKDGQAVAGTKVAWSSSLPIVVSVDSAGLVTALAPGSAIITATVGALTATANIFVVQVPATVQLSYAADTLRSLGDTVRIQATIRDSANQAVVNPSVTWTSTKSTVASVTNGLVTAQGNGGAYIRVAVPPRLDSVPVNVRQRAVTLQLSGGTDTIRALGDTTRLTVNARDARNQPILAGIVWTTASPAVVAVAAGLVTAIANGAGYIRVAVPPLADSVRVAVRQRADASQSLVTLNRPLIFVGDTSLVTLETRDARGNRLAFGGATVAFSVGGGTSGGAFLLVTDQGNGLYTAGFVGSAMGTAVSAGATVNTVSMASTASLRVAGFTRIAASGGTITSTTTTSGGHTCGIITTGDLYCWGISWFGIRGNGTSGSMNAGTVATLVSGGYQWKEVGAGAYYVCGLTAAGAAYCWGDGDVGQIGIGQSGSPPDVTTPAAVQNGATESALSTGFQNGSCSITQAGAAHCWGGNSWGRIGNNSETLAAVPAAVSGGLTFAAISTSFAGTCGITTGGAAYCWGSEYMLGVAAPDTCVGPSGCAKTPVAVSGGYTFQPVIAIDGNTACAVHTDGTQYCWGSGALGNGLTGTKAPPGPVSGGQVYASLATGDGAHCGVTTGAAAYCWGKNDFGQLGDGTLTDRSSPVLVSGALQFVRLSMSQAHTCGITTNGHAYCWGGNDRGELGDRTTTQRLTPVRVRLLYP